MVPLLKTQLEDPLLALHDNGSLPHKIQAAAVATTPRQTHLELHLLTLRCGHLG